ncbi:MAG TPA: hypothetical protein VFK86_21315 [Bauldia sp.]|nr:hypothetical protein [Bauldia sp.]
MKRRSLIRGAFVLAFLFAGTAGSPGRDEVAVGQCGLAFVNAGNDCERTYGGAGPDPPDGGKLEICWDKATSEYNSCMDKALAAAPPNDGPRIDPSKRELLDSTISGGGAGPSVKPQ